MRKVDTVAAVEALAYSHPTTYGDDAHEGRKKRWTVMIALDDLVNSGGYTLVDTEDLIYVRRFIDQLLGEVNREYYEDNDWWIRRLDMLKRWLEEDSPVESIPPISITGTPPDRLRVLEINEILQKLRKRYPKAVETQWAGVIPFYHNLRKAGMVVADAGAELPPFDGAAAWREIDGQPTWVCEVMHLPETGWEVLRWLVLTDNKTSHDWISSAYVLDSRHYPSDQVVIVRKVAVARTEWVHWSDAVNLRHASGRKIAGVGRQDGNPYYWFHEGDVATEPERIEVDNDNWKIEVQIEDD